MILKYFETIWITCCFIITYKHCTLLWLMIGCLHSVLCWTQCYSHTLHCYYQSWCCVISVYLNWTCTPADITWNTYGLSVILTGKCCATKAYYTWSCEHGMDHIHFNMWTLHVMSVWLLFISLYIYCTMHKCKHYLNILLVWTR